MPVDVLTGAFTPLSAIRMQRTAPSPEGATDVDVPDVAP